MESLHIYSNDKYKRYINACLWDAAIVFWVVPLSSRKISYTEKGRWLMFSVLSSQQMQKKNFVNYQDHTEGKTYCKGSGLSHMVISHHIMHWNTEVHN